ncbi:MAG: acyl-ACP--UDP-N-acetylglucosamine O-acyltransferase [Puniceicoccales bacterium]|jgi:UDP-N-acetylglucosamine acyltransferase|nr:acyl-ACP--UDP-N-acetylglucosamine O-acyltransferase [Puniceicoccales bacterium]
MSAIIHSSAIVEKGAQLFDDVSIDAYAYVGKMVSLGKGTHVCHHATIDGRTQVGENNVIHPYAYVGAPTHDVKYMGGFPGLRIGNGNTFREYCTVHTATKEESETVLGNNNLLLAYAHVAHDCTVGNNVIMSSQAALGGHVVLCDFTNIGWSAGIHQFCRIGKYSMVGALSKTTQDVIPYMLADGNPSRVRYPNVVNLRRHNFSDQQISQIKKIFKIFYSSGLNKAQAIEKIKSEFIISDLLNEFLSFVDSTSRGFA